MKSCVGLLKIGIEAQTHPLDSSPEPGAFDQLVIRFVHSDESRSSPSEVPYLSEFWVLESHLSRKVAKAGCSSASCSTTRTLGNLMLSVALPLSGPTMSSGVLFAEINLELLLLHRHQDLRGVGDHLRSGQGWSVLRLFRERPRREDAQLRGAGGSPGRQRTSQGATHYTDAAERDILVAYSPVLNPVIGGASIPLNWGVVIEEPAEHSYSLVSTMTRENLKYVLVTAILTVLVIVYASYRITQPLRLLAEGARQFGQGFLEARIHVRVRNEIGELASTFNQMAASIKDYTEQLKAKAEEMRQLFLESICAGRGDDAKDPIPEAMRGGSRTTRSHRQGNGPRRAEVRGSLYCRPAARCGQGGDPRRDPEQAGSAHAPGMGDHEATPGSRREDHVPDQKVVARDSRHDPAPRAMDGTGYLDGLKGEHISSTARIICVADTFDAMTTDRPYQKKMRDDYAINTIRGLSSKRFEPQVVQAFFALT